jgi:hypothetical protein
MYGNRNGNGASINRAMVPRTGSYPNPRAAFGATTNGAAIPAPRPGPNGGMVTPGGVECPDLMAFQAQCNAEIAMSQGNAGIMGCTIEGNFCGYQILGYCRRDIAPGAEVTFEINALRAGSFKPRYVYMFGTGSDLATSGTNTRFEVMNVTSMSDPQFINAGEIDYCVLSDSFNRSDDPVPVSWHSFGNTPGTGLSIRLRSLTDIVSDVYVTLWGDAANCGVGLSY